MKYYRAVIVDDELMNIKVLKRIIAMYCANVRVVGQAVSNEDAVVLINNKMPDIIFLDIVMREESIFEIMSQLNVFDAQIIFVTSESRFAHLAFKYDAADFILKPLVNSEVILGIQKAIKKIELQKFFDNPHMEYEETRINFIAVPSIEKIDFLKISDIMFFTADGKYTCIYLSNGNKHLTNKNLGDYEKTLDRSIFFRIHNSYIINMEYVVKINKKDGTYCELTNGLTIPIAKRRQEDFNKFIKVKE